MAERNYNELARRIEQDLLDGSFKREISSRKYNHERKKDFTYDMFNLALNAAYVVGTYYLLR